ncbi:recombinase family protein [Streptomyces sp. NPDC101160]|uniref:recombinase family protein n=1 Tax=Streptomyces sp. NPDC101160 TaxID=3366118 RepID=UPI003800BF98
MGGHIIDWADDWEVSGATDPMTRPKLGPWLRDEPGKYDGLVAAAVDRLGRNVVDCLNTSYKMRDEGKLLGVEFWVLARARKSCMRSVCRYTTSRRRALSAINSEAVSLPDCEWSGVPARARDTR